MSRQRRRVNSRQLLPMNYPESYFSRDIIEEKDIWQAKVCPYSKVLLMGDSIVKHLDKINNTQVLAYKGIRIKQLAVRVRQNKIPHLDSKVLVVVHVGTNNVQSDNPEQMFKKTRFLLDSIRDKLPHATIAVSLIIPRPIDHAIRGHKVKEYNYMLTNWAPQLGIKTIPTYRHFLLHAQPIDDLYAIDKLHPGEFGIPTLENYLDRTLGRIEASIGIRRTKRAPPSTVVMEKIKGQCRR